MRLTGNLRWQESVSIIAPQIRADGVHIWPFDPSLPVAVTFQVFGVRQPVRMNRHDYFELVYVHSGEVACQVAGRSFVAKRGELIVMGSSLYHRLARTTGVHPKVCTLFFMPEVICEAGANGDTAEFLVPFYLQDATFPHLVPAKTGIPAEAFNLMQRIHAELPAETNRARLSVRTYLRMILISLVNHYSSYVGSLQVVSRKQQASQRIAPLFEFLETHYMRTIAVQDAAEVLHISKAHFMRLFKQVTGQSFISYLNHFRIAKAQAVLASSKTPISQVCQEVGFCDQSYFGSVFRKIVHTTPMAYKRHHSSSTGDTHVHNMTSSPQGRSQRENMNPHGTRRFPTRFLEGLEAVPFR